MIGFFCPENDNKCLIKKEQILFVSVPNDLAAADVRVRFSKMAKDYANALDINKVYLFYGKDDFIEYEFTI